MAYIVGEVIPIEKSKEQEARELPISGGYPEKFLFPRNIFEMTKEERAIEEQRRVGRSPPTMARGKPSSTFPT
ncbi:MAG: hypothetical protein IPQ18_03005 [Saprospiraceae bacterium]|nr:hypothetical protein [Saprospiraceae bacterium]